MPAACSVFGAKGGDPTMRQCTFLLTVVNEGLLGILYWWKVKSREQWDVDMSHACIDHTFDINWS